MGLLGVRNDDVVLGNIPVQDLPLQEERLMRFDRIAESAQEFCFRPVFVNGPSSRRDDQTAKDAITEWTDAGAE